jgi:hypothetical protein
MAEPMPWEPLTVHDAQQFAFDVYRRAQHVDEWGGNDYEGTSVNAGMKILHEAGFIDGWRWAFSGEDVRDAVINLGPVVIGVWWYEGMFHPRRSGLLEVTGRKVGGHCVAVTGYSPSFRLGIWEGWWNRFEVFEIQQSWARGHGKDGRVFIRAQDLYRLLADEGEAAIPTGRKPVRVG